MTFLTKVLNLFGVFEYQLSADLAKYDWAKYDRA